VLSVWDSLATNPASQRLHEMALALMPDNPPAFMARPFSMHDVDALRALAELAEFASVDVETVALIGVSDHASDLATGLVRGNPLWNELVDRNLDAEAFQAKLTAVLAAEFGDSPCKTPLSAHILTAVA
jgi:hypothetical protein